MRAITRSGRAARRAASPSPSLSNWLAAAGRRSPRPAWSVPDGRPVRALFLLRVCRERRPLVQRGQCGLGHRRLRLVLLGLLLLAVAPFLTLGHRSSPESAPRRTEASSRRRRAEPLARRCGDLAFRRHGRSRLRLSRAFVCFSLESAGQRRPGAPRLSRCTWRRAFRGGSTTCRPAASSALRGGSLDGAPAVWIVSGRLERAPSG